MLSMAGALHHLIRAPSHSQPLTSVWRMEDITAHKEIEADRLFKSLAAQEPEAETEAFRYSRCKQKKCRYRQAQTRGPGEPITTFVTCIGCGNT
ncbi:hypothetical protein BKA70DRAFT_1298785, partial [Coprinopsis sp. MPI-PUGE-AT-0042]